MNRPDASHRDFVIAPPMSLKMTESLGIHENITYISSCISG
jgi:hypothetical protein